MMLHQTAGLIGLALIFAVLAVILGYTDSQNARKKRGPWRDK